MAFVQAKSNVHDFSEVTENDVQVLITNGDGRDYDPFEIVQSGGYVGEVREYDGIPDTESGRIDISHDRTIRTAQIEVTDTFVVGQIVYFLPGGSVAAGELRATPEAGSVPYGKCTAFGGTGGAHTYVEVRPFSQGAESQAGSGLKVLEVVVPAGSHAAGAPVVTTDIPVGSKIIDITALATATSGSGTVSVGDGTNTITTTAVVMAVADALSRAVDLDETYRTVVAAGLTLTANGAADAGIVHVYYI